MLDDAVQESGDFSNGFLSTHKTRNGNSEHVKTKRAAEALDAVNAGMLASNC